MRRLGIVVAVLFAVCMSGCIKVDQKLTVNKDGSGELDMSYSMKESVIQQMESMAKMQVAQGGAESQGDADQFEFNEDSLRKELSAYEDQGIEIVSIDSKSATGWKTMHVKLGFEDLNALAKTEMMQDNNFSLKKNAAGNYVLVQKTGEDVADDAGGEENMTPEMLQQMAPMFAGMRIVQRIKVPGKIVRSNATEVEGDLASWIYDVDKDPTVINKIKNLNMEIEFDGAGLKLQEI